MANTNKEYVLVTEYFHPDTASTGQLMTDLAVGLQERGLDMTVVTGQPAGMPPGIPEHNPPNPPRRSTAGSPTSGRYRLDTSPTSS